jgi:hypothetical protein
VADIGGAIALRNSNHPDCGTLLLTRRQLSAWVDACKASEFDDLAI